MNDLRCFSLLHFEVFVNRVREGGEEDSSCLSRAGFDPVNIILHTKTSWTKDIYQPQKQPVFPFLSFLYLSFRRRHALFKYFNRT